MAAFCYVARDGRRRAKILSPSTTTPGEWRITSWDHIGPSGHTEHRDLETALGELVRDLDHYQPTDHEPPWLGLTVITEGRVDPLGAPPPPA